MHDVCVARVLLVTVALFYESTLVQALDLTTSSSQTSNFPGPCRAWVFPCGRGTWVCTTEAAYWGFIYGPQPECPAVYPQTTAPPPGECRLVNGACKFTDSELSCKAWVDLQNGNKCGNVSEYVEFTKSSGSLAPKGFGQYPPPNQLCLPVNETCQWYDPCLYWRDEFCAGDFTCGSADEYYAFLYGHRPSCTPPSPGQMPPAAPLGQCAIKKDMCDWYACAAWMGWCDSGWECGTVYDRDTYESRPPPSCPIPPPGTHPPPLPGACRFNISSGQCNFFPNNTDPCHQPIYPPGFLTHCNVLLKQWTYNSTTGECTEFYYYACGEDRDGYNVFTTEEQCTTICVKQAPCRHSIYPAEFDPESCTSFLRQWTYSEKFGQCVEFNYHSCGEDRNGYDVFDTEEECITTCVL